ncbi:ABC transporter substrate-binding protein [Phycicoccus sonneratiae]|uniref:Carbohydrate ABC transporter substrate-binding protein n=1 Tax=Phycicoccus sonneratiae TaxID=2807628 RepID=A0ABS2CFX8_9MICO|nr:ABC transporter substrate-binding protein [Phycicoccus sonneraticus]MBM6398787.1 carbohydrate ABC transporter substrate-binding protein [Phycicoccus sonneraticus]
MARPAPRESHLAGTLPASVGGFGRRSLLRGALGVGALGAAGMLTACGDDGGSGSGASAKAGNVKFGINEAKGSGPANERLQAMADAYAKKAGVTVSVNAVDHNTFQESITTYLQGSPDDVFTWFAGYRMAQFAEGGQIADVSDVWPLDGIGDAFKKASTAADGKQYFVPVSYYPWAVFHRKSVFEKNGWTQPTTMDELTELMKEMQGKKMTPFAFAAKDAWAPMGTFDILNMRLNGFDFHMALTKGEKTWDSPEVRNVFSTWKTLLPYHQENSLGRTWQEAATSMAKGECGMYLLGTFVVDGVPTEAQEDLDFFTFPALDQTIGADALDAPIDGFCVASGAQDEEAGKAFITWLASAEAADAANNSASAPFIAANSAASTAKYGELQKKSVEVVQNAKSIAQFLDRDTNADLANTVITASLQEFIKKPDSIDSITTSIQQQAKSILG